MAEVLCGIYGIRNENSNSEDYGKMYIGQSKDIYDRWKEHEDAITCKRMRNPLELYQAVWKDGYENFRYYILEFCNPSELDGKEIYWINYYNSYENGYNKTRGGIGSGSIFASVGEPELNQIIDLLRYSDEPLNKIADKFSVAPPIISSINNGKTYRRGI